MSLRSIAAATLLLVPLTAASPVAAKKYTLDETRRHMADYAECVVKTRPGKASEAILANVPIRIILRKYRTLISPHCLAQVAGDGSKMTFHGDLYRYALADALVSRELSGQTAPDLTAVAPLDHPEPPEEPSEFTKSGKKLSEKAHAEAKEDHAEDVAFGLLSRYGECVVRTATAESRSLVLSEPTSTAEKAVFDALRPALASCLADGETLKFGVTALRGAIAINYYRLAHAARGTVTKAAE